MSWAHCSQTTRPLEVLLTWSSLSISPSQEGQIMMHWLMRLTVKKKIAPGDNSPVVTNPDPLQ